jgi:hypothetical protein
MRRFILATAAITALGVAAVAPALASADVQRYQTQDATFTLTQPAGQVGQWGNVWTHKITVQVNPCDNTFSGTGIESGQDQNGPSTFNEKVTGKFGDGTVSLTVTRDDGVVFALSNAPTDSNTVTLATSSPVVPQALEFRVTEPTFANTSTYKNHGDYVSAMGGGADAAHSCIGMPINSGK